MNKQSKNKEKTIKNNVEKYKKSWKNIKKNIIINKTIKERMIIMAFKITEECIKCGACAALCPQKCISEGEEKYKIDEAKCIECGQCASVCPVGAPVFNG